MNSSLLFEEPRTFLYWWTFVPVLPENNTDPHYRALKRQWADHTMNCLSKKSGSWKLSSSRGFYVERREDHIATVLFHIWASFPESDWVGRLLDLWHIPHGTIKRASWSYSWEQKADGASRPDITDIVLCWEDQEGQAVLIIEAKRPGGKLSDKALDGGQRYLRMPSIRPFQRKFVAFLLSERDIHAAKSMLPLEARVLSWEDMARLQADESERLNLPQGIRSLIRSYIAKHYSDLGMPFCSVAELPLDNFDGSAKRYESARALALPSSIERFLLGSEVSFCARAGRMPTPPLPWLATEPSFVDVVQARAQTTREREEPLWRLR